MSAIFFQPPGIKKEYVEPGIIVKDELEYIHYMKEPAKILITEVKIIPEEQVYFDKKEKLFKIKHNDRTTNNI